MSNVIKILRDVEPETNTRIGPRLLSGYAGLKDAISLVVRRKDPNSRGIITLDVGKEA
jgi:hypothetical protein